MIKKIIRKLEPVTHKETLRELVWSLKKRWLKGSPVTVFTC